MYDVSFVKITREVKKAPEPGIGRISEAYFWRMGLIFQSSLGIQIHGETVAVVYLKTSLKGIQVGGHGLYSLERDQPLKERLTLIRRLIAEVRQEYKIGKADVFIGIPDDVCMFREISFPLAVKENLRDTLRYEMEKYIPLTAEDVYFDYQIIEEKRDKNFFKAILVVAKKNAVDPYIEFCKTLSPGVLGADAALTAEANGLAYAGRKKPGSVNTLAEMMKKQPASPEQLASLGLPSPELLPAFGLALRGLWNTPFQINLLPPAFRRKPGRMGYYIMIILFISTLIAGVMWGGGFLIRRHMAVKALDAQMSHLEDEVRAVEQTRERIKTIESRFERMKNLNERHVVILDILRELTQMIPNTAWVQEFSLKDNKIYLDGYAASASDLIPLLEDSPLFKNVVFLSTIVKEKDGKERFRIGFELESVSGEENR